MKSKFLTKKIFTNLNRNNMQQQKKNNVFIVIKCHQFDYSRISLNRSRRRVDENENEIAFVVKTTTTIIFDVIDVVTFDVFVKIFLKNFFVLNLKWRNSYFFIKFLQSSHVDFDFQWSFFESQFFYRTKYCHILIFSKIRNRLSIIFFIS